MDKEKNDTNEKTSMMSNSNQEGWIILSMGNDSTEEIDLKTNDYGQGIPVISTECVASSSRVELPLTATIIIAAPCVEGHKLAITGEDQNLGNWKQSYGNFETILAINKDLHIFKGIVPIPSIIGSPFKFVHVNTNPIHQFKKMKYEGDGKNGNRIVELFPDSWNFFVFQPHSKNLTYYWKKAQEILGKPKIKEEIAYHFFNILFSHTLETMLPEWDDALEFLDDGLQKIRHALSVDYIVGFRQFFDHWIREPELRINFDRLFLLMAGACKMKVILKEMAWIDVSDMKNKKFSLYLHSFSHSKRRPQDLLDIFEFIAKHAGSKFWWINFRTNRHLEGLQKYTKPEVTRSILNTLQEIPEVLLNDQEHATRVVDYLVRWNNIGDLSYYLCPIIDKNVKYQPLLDPLLLQSLVDHKTTVYERGKIICSKFMENAYKTAKNHHNENFDKTIKIIFDHKNPSDIISIAFRTPDYLLDIVKPIVESNVSQILANKCYTNVPKEEYNFFSSQLENEKFNHFPQAKQKIEAILLNKAIESVKLGYFYQVNSVRLTLLGLAEMEIPFLVCPEIVELQKAVVSLPPNYFQNLCVVLKYPGVPLDKTLKPYCKGDKTKYIVGVLKNHFDQLEKLIEKVKMRQIPLKEFPVLQDPQVLDLLKIIGLTGQNQDEFYQEVEKLTECYKLYGNLYSKFSLFTRPTKNTGDDENTNMNASESIQVLNSNEWEKYLNEIHSENSILTLADAMKLQPPLILDSARWLFEIKENVLFMEIVWHPAIESLENHPLCFDDLKGLVVDCATKWRVMARTVAEGTISFKQMDEIIKLQPDPNLLSRNHLLSQPIDGVLTAYRNFKNLQKLRQLIGPFVAALRLFSIKQRKPIDKLYDFVENNLLKDWDRTTLAQVEKAGILRVVNEDLKINPERPETWNAMQFVGSLVAIEGNRSQLIEWLRKNDEKDMEAMGKILQGTLLEAYGQLQTLRTRIAPFLQEEFDTFHHLLLKVRTSEEHFAQRISGRVQPINCRWLATMLPEIEAAVRASIVSPSEDAKEKLAKLHQIIIEPKDETYSMKIRLEPKESLSMEELKQAFQLLDMTVMDDRHNSDDFASQTRRIVHQIEQLSVVFESVFASGCITYKFHEPVVIELPNLDEELRRLREQLEEWSKQWKEIEEMSLLALFSRGYLLHLVDLIGKKKTEDVVSILKILLPSQTLKMETTVNEFVQKAPHITDGAGWFSAAEVFHILRDFHTLIKDIFHENPSTLAIVDDPALAFLRSYGRTLKSHFNSYTAVVILNVSREILVGSALTAYTSLTRQPIEPSRILFVTTNTGKQEVERFMKLWSIAKFIDQDIFIIVHVERLTAACANVVRESVDRVLPERRAKLLLLAQHQHRAQSTKSLGARLGLVSDRLLDNNFTADQLRQCFSKLLPNSEHLHFFTSKLPGCGKSQQAMKTASELKPSPDYYRICVRSGTVEELLASLKSIKNLSTNQSRDRAVFLHLDVAHSVSLEFNDTLLFLLMHGALYDPKKAKLGYWMMSPQTNIAVEFASPFGAEHFPIIDYLGKHHICKCDKSFFTYELADIPGVIGQPVTVNSSNALIVAGKFLQLKKDKQQGLTVWNDLCSHPESITNNPLEKDVTFDLLVASFECFENRNDPTFSALHAMASFLNRHICVMIVSPWFNCSAVNLFEKEFLASVFKLNIFDLLLKVANDCITRCWSVVNRGKKLTEMDWVQRQRAMFLLGCSDMVVTGMNVVGRDAKALKNMFDPALLPILQLQRLQFQELRGFQNLLESSEGAEVILNAMRSIFLLDGTASSFDKIKQLDDHDRNTSASQRLKGFIGQDQGYVLTGDNITKMMFALYRIRCGLPVVVFGETGVGKTALFRFLIQTLLGHTLMVCNVNSGTTIQDVEGLVQSATKKIMENSKAQVFLFLDEMNTADPPVIAFIKELMLDRHCHGSILPQNLNLIGAANPYRHLKKTNKEVAVGLAFRFAQPTRNNYDSNAQTDGRNLVYRVNELPLAFYDHFYDFGHLCDEAEQIYIDEICQHGLKELSFSDNRVKWFTDIIQNSHRAAREMSVDPESAVSLRDAARAVQLFYWFYQSPAGLKLSERNQQKAADLTIYLVYAFRFSERETFLKKVFGENQSASKNMTDVSRFITKELYNKAHGASIGSGAIALNDALCENLFALYVCVLNGIFLIIVGRPGSSKSLSVEILKLVLSPGNHTLRQELGDLPALTELYFQCSPMSTSSGFKALFESAQRLSVDPKMMLAMVVLDELGLADISPEKPIKVLHSELERQSFLTSGEKQQSAYSVIALSNWLVDAAQINRGILILRTQADRNDLLESAKQLAESLITKLVKESDREFILETLTESLESIVNIYKELDEREDIGGGYFFSMRDFFFCVKNYVCSVLETTNFNNSSYVLVQAAIRNFGGHEKARKVVKKITVDNLQITHIPEMSSLDLIVKNILDSSKPESIHVARHLMVLNRSLIGLQLLNRHVKKKLDNGTNWNVIFGSCFPGDLQVTAVTRKLRQVEQAIRSGGVLVLCHADQLFESLYMVLNQQYWAQGDVTMTQIALGPSNRAIALPRGPFRVIALQDTDVALNRELMSPAILSRFEKHELRLSHLLNENGRNCQRAIESHPVWLAVPEEIKRQQLIYGYHEESFASLALHLQEKAIPMEVKEDKENNDQHFENIWMPSINPMAMIKIERHSCTNNNTELEKVCRRYRNKFVLESLEDALQNSKSNRMVIMTNTLRHLEIMSFNSPTSQHFTIQLFEIQSELELFRRLESFDVRHLSDPDFCLIVQYDAVTGPIEQFQLAKYEVEQRFQKANCRVIFIVHVDPRPVNMHWVFSFGDNWDYFFVDEVVRVLADQHRIALKELVQSPTDAPLSNFIEKLSVESFKSLLFEMLGPDLQIKLVCLHSFLGKFYSGMRTALGLPDNQRLVKLLKECLLAQLKDSSIIWNIVDAIDDPSFDSSSSLTNGLWGVFKQKISDSLAHLLLASDAWRVSDQWSMELWCDFVDDNYPDRLLSPGTSDSVVQMPIGFRICTRPLSRLFSSFKISQNISEPLKWLLDRLSKNEDDDSEEMKQAYFLDWFLLHIHPHLHRCLSKVPLSKMSHLVDELLEEPVDFFVNWEQWKAKVIAALELVSIVSFAKSDDGDLWSDASSRMNSWESFTNVAARLSLTTLTLPDVIKSRERFMMAVSSVEVSSALMNLLNNLDDLAQLLLGLRTTKRILLFDPESEVTLPKSLVSTPQKLFDNLTELVINSVIRPLADSTGNLRQTNLITLLKSTSACGSPIELENILGECPTHNSFVLLEENVAGAKNNGRCSSCKQTLTATKEDDEGRTHLVNHLRAPNATVIETLFRDHQKFMFFFERVAELFIQQRKQNPRDIQDFFRHLLSSDCRFRVSWRFLTVIVRTVLSTDGLKTGNAIIDELLLNIPCNQPTHKLNPNAKNLLLALLVCFDQDVQNNPEEDPDLIQAAVTDHWNVERIRKLAHIRRQLSKKEGSGIENVINKWSSWRKNQTDQSITDSLLFFILRFCSAEGDQTQLGNIFHNPRIVNELQHHIVVNNYIETISPLSLGFILQSAEVTANPFQERLLNGDRFGEPGAFEHYPLLVDLQPNWAPFIARLAYHAFDIFEAKRISFLREMSLNLDAADQFLLPGIENHPFEADFRIHPQRYYFCNCRQLCFVEDCGRVTAYSICRNCNTPLGHNHVPRDGVRLATAQDFQPPMGIFVSRKPITTPNFAVRNCSPAVTRFALLLNSLALMNAALNPRITPQAICKFLLTLPLTDRQQSEDRRSFIQLLSNHIIVHLDLLCQLLVTCQSQFTMTDKFRIGHLLLHKLLASQNSSFLTTASDFRKEQARETFERGLTELFAQQVNLVEELDHIARQSDEASKVFRQSLLENETLHWAYARRVFADRQSVQLELARNDQLRAKYPFLNFLLDDDNGMRKLNALQHLGEALRFIALVRTVLSGEITQEEANRMSIAQGLEKMIEIVMEKGIILDRGRAVTSQDHVMNLFDGFKQLWDRFSQFENAEKKTFLDYFECQQVDINARPKTVLDQKAPLILICAGSEPAESMFSCQLLNHAVEAASSIALTNFIQPHCRKDSGRVRLSCSCAEALADFDDSLYAHVSTEEVDRFIRDHVIDSATLPLAESFAMSAILGSAGSTIAEELSLDVIPEFQFKDDTESGNFLATLERRSLAWQPSSIPHRIQELILADLEKNRSLAEARSVLISVITHLYSTTEPLIISKIRNNNLSDVLEELLTANILTERHMSEATKIALNQHLKLEVRQVFGLLKAISFRMKGDDVRVPEGWTTMLSDSLAQQTRAQLLAEPGDVIVGTLLLLANNVTDSESVPVSLMPGESLLLAIRYIQGQEWNGIPAELKMENLGHVLRIAESLPKK